MHTIAAVGKNKLYLFILFKLIHILLSNIQ